MSGTLDTSAGGELFGYGIATRGLPGAWPVASQELPARYHIDWRINGRMAANGREWWTEERPGGLLVGWATEAEYLVLGGRSPRVVVRLGPASEDYAALSFAIAILPLALPLFDLEPFHGSAVAWDRVVIALLGPVGAGKSSLASAAIDLGATFLADDACAIDRDGFLWPGPPIYAPRTSDGGLSETYEGKRVIRLEDHQASPASVSACAILDVRSGPLAVQSVPALEAFSMVLEHARAPWALPHRRAQLQLSAAAKLASGPVLRVGYDHARHDPSQVVAAILEVARSLPASAEDPL